MKRSRLNLFRATSMTISLLGILMIITAIIVLVWIGGQYIYSGFSSNADTGPVYNELAALKSELSTLKVQYEDVKKETYKTDDKKIKKAYIDAELELVKAEEAISYLESALSTNLPIEEINARLSAAKTQLQKAKASLNNVRSMLK